MRIENRMRGMATRLRGAVAGLLMLSIGFWLGCQGSTDTSVAEHGKSESASQPAKSDPLSSERVKISSRSVLGSGEGSPVSPPMSTGGASGGFEEAAAQAGERDATESAEDESAATLPELPPRTLGDLIRGDDSPFEASRMEIDQERVQAAGILRVSGKHLDLYSDLRDLALLQELVEVFDAATPQWCARFGVDVEQVEDWRVSGFLVADKERMAQAGLFPDDLPPFPNGYQRGFELWCYEQPSAFYRRYLLLHEGTHAFMTHQLGGMGPPWYSEGMAEYLAVHEWHDGELQMATTIESAKDAPLWGRVRMIRDGFERREARMPEDIMMMDGEEFFKNETYGWAWGLCHFLDHHPRYRDSFRALQSRVADRSPGFVRPFLDEYQDDWARLRTEWQLFIGEVDYGYDVAGMALDEVDEVALGSEPHRFAVVSDRGWQSTGLVVPAGTRLKVSASGRVELSGAGEVWPSEPGGVTIDYYRGRPVGELICAVGRPEDALERLTPLLVPTPIGTEQALEVDRPGVLYLRINLPPDGLDENQGVYQATIEAVR